MSVGEGRSNGANLEPGFAAPSCRGPDANRSANWTVNVSKAGGFSVAMPGTPTESKKPVKTAKGQLVVTMLVAEGRQDSLFVVSYSDFPEAEVKKETVDVGLDNIRDGYCQCCPRQTFRSEKAIKLAAKYPGRELVVEKDV